MMESSVLSLPIREQAVMRARTDALPWLLVAMVFAASSVILGLIWDISWHMTIGRDTFWTPAHLAIYTGGAVAGMASGYEVLRRSFFSTARPTDGVTIWRVFNGPLGAWLAIWGAVAMLTSAPFDDWWHNAYGLDVQIISPPHSLLALGFVAILSGAVVMATSVQSQAASRASSRAPWIVAYASGLVLSMIAIFCTEYHDRTLMHSGIFYAVAALAFPFGLVAAGRSTRLRYPATAAAAVYTAVMCLQVWILPLFEATPKLGPIRQLVTHMVPLNFPLLLLVPAVLIDIVLQRTESRGAWTRALMLGLTFLVSFTVVQWPFADFLMSDASRNALFRTDNFAYMIPSDWLLVTGEFQTESRSTTLGLFALAAVLAVLSARAGLARGNWLRAVRR